MAAVLAFLLLLSPAALAQRSDLWSNAGLTARGMQAAEQQGVLRKDMAQCHGAAFEGSRELEDEEKRKARGVALFRACMAQKGWRSRDPAARKPAPNAARPTST